MRFYEVPEIRATRYRRMAAEFRRQADALDQRQERPEFLAMAEQYERIAERLASARGGSKRRQPGNCGSR
jgi:phytoene/squalene synthetase